MSDKVQQENQAAAAWPASPNFYDLSANAKRELIKVALEATDADVSLNLIREILGRGPAGVTERSSISVRISTEGPFPHKAVAGATLVFTGSGHLAGLQLLGFTLEPRVCGHGGFAPGEERWVVWFPSALRIDRDGIAGRRLANFICRAMETHELAAKHWNEVAEQQLRAKESAAAQQMTIPQADRHFAGQQWTEPESVVRQRAYNQRMSRAMDTEVDAVPSTGQDPQLPKRLTRQQVAQAILQATRLLNNAPASTPSPSAAFADARRLVNALHQDITNCGIE